VVVCSGHIFRRPCSGKGKPEPELPRAAIPALLAAFLVAPFRKCYPLKTLD
jgi:hypothetical protein